ncbi:hypothetical protein DB30_04037 [Enhygromyxa salina]|uniref:HPr domain-containing protein n=2 Tax=Enhygromyxa salina TaxID=215803 RepID=A0A0C2D592_9BACT|nr:hypothetical protein DB30_04037 [Enhygromyxa salina]
MRQYACKLTIECDSHAIANARVLFDLLILGVRAGERVTLRCVGPDAHAAIEDVARVLRGRGAQ